MVKQPQTQTGVEQMLEIRSDLQSGLGLLPPLLFGLLGYGVYQSQQTDTGKDS